MLRARIVNEKEIAMKQNHVRMISALACAAAIAIPLSACDDSGLDEKTSSRASEPTVPESENAMRQAQAPVTIVPAPGLETEPAQSATGQVDDAALSSRIQAALSADSELKAANIEVKSDGGVVTLTGRAEHANVKSKASRITLAVNGVKEVRNELVVVTGS
jgi:hyperosmotically inducible protein